MAKNKNIIRYILLIAAFVSGIELYALTPTALPPDPPETSFPINRDGQGQALKGKLRERISEVYSSQIGIRERTNQNDGKEVEMYLASAGLAKGNPWCAGFVTWSYKTAGIKAVKSGYSPAWFPREKVIWQNQKGETPRQADVFGIYFASKGRVAHVGFIDAWQDGNYAVTVEGNTNEGGSRDGDGVYRKRRLKRQIYIISRWL